MTAVPVRLVVNGAAVDAQMEPRTLLGDFLRDDLRLTGLHLACEHGVCGGCNVEIDGQLGRACTHLAVRCDARHIRTIEGFDDDQLMGRLRQAFTAEHALQCGYCTPGMLMAARDIVLRLRAPSEVQVRRELAGNLCRCTGYAGIVRAILQVTEDFASDEAWEGLQRLRSAPSTARAKVVVASSSEAPSLPRTAAETQGSEELIPLPRTVSADGRATAIERRFTVPHSRDVVWRLFSQTAQVAACMPGLEIRQVQEDDRLRGVFTVKAGPIRAVFSTIARVTRDDASFSGRVETEGRDRISKSSTVCQLDYVLENSPGNGATDITIAAIFHIEGRLAEFSRPEIVAALVSQLTERFAANVAHRLSGGAHESSAVSSEPLRISLAGMGAAWLRVASRACASWWRALAERR